MTWEEVRARSLSGSIYCFDCYMNFGLVEMPCLKHCQSDEERTERDRRYGKQMSAMSYKPPWLKLKK